MVLSQHMREQYCQTSERVEADYIFPPKDEPTLLYELQRVQDSLDSRPPPLVNYSSTDESESDLSQSNAYTSADEDIPSDHQSGQMAQQTLQSK